MSQNTAVVQYLHARKNTNKKHASKKQGSTKSNSDSPSATKDKNTNHEGRKITCFRCGGNHMANKCSISSQVKCRFCSTIGHTERVCFKKKNPRPQVDLVAEYEEDEVYEILQLKEKKGNREKFITKLDVNGREVAFEVDSDAAVTLISKHQVEQLFPDEEIQFTNMRLITYYDTEIHVVGYITVSVRY